MSTEIDNICVEFKSSTCKIVALLDHQRFPHFTRLVAWNGMKRHTFWYVMKWNESSSVSCWIWLLFFCIIIITFPYCKYISTNKPSRHSRWMHDCLRLIFVGFSSSQYLHFSWHNSKRVESSEQQCTWNDLNSQYISPLSPSNIILCSQYISIVREQQHEKKSETFIRFSANNNKRAKQSFTDDRRRWWITENTKFIRKRS